MQTANQIAVVKVLEFCIQGEIDGNVPSLLQSVRKALDDIKKEDPSLSGMGISEMSFFSDTQGVINLKVIFEN
ncbi:MAG: hypothetical protein Q7J85_13475 [Bacillota bacterium]|nr:hypothetical protein [Bacillota bacterium]